MVLSEEVYSLCFMWIFHFQVPHVQLPHLVPQSQHLWRNRATISEPGPRAGSRSREGAHLLPEVHGEAHVPDVTLAVVKAPQDGHIGFVGLDVVNVVLHLSWFPTDNGVFAGLIKRRSK